MSARSENTRQNIVEKAALLFNEKGIAGTSIDDILRASKVAKGCLYGHFESKEELSYASVDYLMDKIVSNRAIALNKHKTAKDKIFAFFQLVKNPLITPFDGGCPIINISTETDDTSPVIKKKMRTMLENSLIFFKSILDTGIENGELSAQLDTEGYATKMFMAIEGANGLCRILNSLKPMQAIIRSLKAELEQFLNK